MAKKIGSFLFLFFIFSVAIAHPILTYQITGIIGNEQTNALNLLNAELEPFKDKLNISIVNQLYQQGPKEIQRAIEPYGYFKSTITKKISSQKNSWIITYHVNPGTPLRITQLSLHILGDGKNDPNLKKTIASLPLKEHGIFNVENYKKAKSVLLNQIQEQGYVDAKFVVDTITIHVPQYLCTINLTLDTGPRFYFGQIHFSGTPLGTPLLTRYLTFKPGDPFSYSRALTSQNNLNGNAFFKSASVIPQKEKAKNNHIPIDINLEMNKRNAYLFGLGYGTDTGARGMIGYQRRWLNSYGHSLNTQLKLSQLIQGFAVQYLIPGKNPNLEQNFISAGVVRILPQSGESVTGSLSIGQVRVISNWQITSSLSLQSERYRVTQDDPFNSSLVLMPTISLIHTTTDNPFNTSNGNQLFLIFSGAAKPLLSSLSFFQAELQDKWIHTFWVNYRMILRGNVGYTATGSLDNFPLSKQFYAGGLESVRGYGFQDLGPGRYLATGTIELQRRIYKEFYGAVFYDMGNAMNHWNTPLKQSTGVGIVWKMPIGPLRVYLSRPLFDKDKHSLSLDFSIGPEL